MASTNAELDQLLAEGYPEHFQAEAEPDPDAEDRQALIDAEIHAHETRLHRPLFPEERDEVETFAGRQYDQAAASADRVYQRFTLDLSHQVRLLERDLGRSLLSHEIDGIGSIGMQHLQVRGQTLDAEAAWQEYWRLENTRTGAKPPDMRDPHDEAEHMANLVKERNAMLRDVAEAAPPPASPDRDTVAREHAERQAEQHRAAATVPMRYRGELGAPRTGPDWSKMSSAEQDAAMAARIAGHDYAEREREPSED